MRDECRKCVRNECVRHERETVCVKERLCVCMRKAAVCTVLALVCNVCENSSGVHFGGTRMQRENGRSAAMCYKFAYVRV